MHAGISDSSPEAERFQIVLFRQASAGRKIALVRSLSTTIIELSRRNRSPRSITVELGLPLPPSTPLAPLTPEEIEVKTPPDLITALIPLTDLFDSWGVDYFIGGSIASSAHGIPRATTDIDLVAALTEDLVKPLGEKLSKSYSIEEAAVRRAVANLGSFNVIHLATMLKLDIFVRGSGEYEIEEARRAARIPFDDALEGRQFPVASAEDMIIVKLDWFRSGGEVSERQWSDITGLIKVRAQTLDWDYLWRWTGRKGTHHLLAKAVTETGPIPSDPPEEWA
ncbi:MAG: hypothetical protein ACO394_06145 [Blastocatellia bacterium]